MYYMCIFCLTDLSIELLAFDLGDKQLHAGVPTNVDFEIVIENVAQSSPDSDIPSSCIDQYMVSESCRQFVHYL